MVRPRRHAKRSSRRAWRPMPAAVRRSAAGITRSSIKEQLALNPPDDLLEAFAALEIGEHERTPAPCARRIAGHHVEACADMHRQVDLVDDEQIGARDA